MSPSPLILTLILDNESQEFFNRLRKQHFPPERNYLDAHLTLFHNLPYGDSIITSVINHVSHNTSPFVMDISSIVSIGNGVAYKIESAELQNLHKGLQREWQQLLIPQDKQKLWPHITVQNKTDAVTANQLISILMKDFKPFKVKTLGFNLWEYKGGPWDFVDEYHFEKPKLF